MKSSMYTLIAALSLLLFAGSASATQSTAKPGFPPGTWIGTGQLFAETGFDGDLITSLSGSATFTLKVSRNGKVTGSGKWTTLQTGDGPVSSKITAVARVTFSGTPTAVRYAGTQVVTTRFGDAAHSQGTTFTRDVSGGLTIKKARSCRVTGGYKVAGEGPWVKFDWTASLKGVKCPK
jgi:hypothetical protein